MSTDGFSEAGARRRALPEWLDRPPAEGAPTRVPVRDDLTRVLDRIDQALALVDGRFNVLFANIAARAAMSEGHPLSIRDGCLELADGRARLAGAIETAIERAGHGYVPLKRAGRSTVVAVVPVPWQGVRAALLLLERTSVCSPLAIQCFASVYGLTLAEARLLELLCQGASPADMARSLGLRVSTIRTHIASVRAKTGASSLRELLRRIAALPPMAGLMLQPNTH